MYMTIKNIYGPNDAIRASVHTLSIKIPKIPTRMNIRRLAEKEMRYFLESVDALKVQRLRQRYIIICVGIKTYRLHIAMHTLRLTGG